jgi:hypothetical protein
LKGIHKDQDENSFQDTKEKGEKELGIKSLQVDSFFEKMCGKKDKGSG